MNIGAIGDVIDQSSKSGPEIEVIYEVNKSAAMIYDMHPVVSFKNHQSDFVYHKKVCNRNCYSEVILEFLD